MLRLIVVVQLETQRSYWRIVGEECLLRHNPDMSRVCHVVKCSIAEDDKGIVFAAGERKKREAEKLIGWKNIQKHNSDINSTIITIKR